MIWESRAFRSRFYRMVWHSTNLIMDRLLGRKVYGWEHVPPEGPCIIASNHINLIDPPFLGTAVHREVGFVAKQELFRFFPLRWLISSLNAMPLRRQGGDAAAVKMIMRKLEQGYAMVMFPEGTRSRTDDFLPPKPGVGMIARRMLVPVVPAYIEGTNRRLGDILSGRCRLLARFGPPVLPETLARYSDEKEGYQEISRLVMDRIIGLKAQHED
jgi:1-acyl-sn-glycerol-3-phosphate acyltransferase